jgi:DNA-binding GntR family transcriptional regulator
MREPENSDPRAYRQMADTLRTGIADGTYQPGRPLPSITTIAQRTNHARATVSKALRILESEGLVRRYPGLGYYVKPAR